MGAGVTARWRLATVFLLLFSGGVAWSQTPPPSEPDPSDLVNSLLAGLLGFGEMGESELQAEVASVGGVPFKTPVPLEYMGKEQLARYLKDLFDAEYPAAEAEADRRTLRAFDLLPAGTDLRALRARVLEENVVGFYDERPDKRRLYVVSEDKRLTPMNQLVLSHELRHALQDQYMNVHALVDEGASDYDDRQLALMSLLEGDATFVMERFLMKRLPGDGLGALSDGSGVFGLGAMSAAAVPGAPPVVRDQLVLPYFAGRDFVQALYGGGGWEAVRAAWSRPPASTEQVLHPEKYRSGEGPRRVRTPSGPSGARLLREGVLGEALVRTWLGEGNEAAAAGWGGDAFACFDVNGRTLLVWRSEWDDDAEAAEFLAAARKRLGAMGTASERGGFLVVTRGEERFALGRSTSGIEFVSADAAALFDHAVSGLTRRAAAAP